MELQVAFNSFSPSHRKGVVIEGPSLTVPDDSLSIKDILYRFSRGLPLGINRYDPLYDDVDDDDFETNPMNEHLEMDEIYNEAVSSKENIDLYNSLIESQNDTDKHSSTSETESDQPSSLPENN